MDNIFEETINDREMSEESERSEHGIAESYNRESKFQNGKNTVTVSLEWNEEDFGYIVYLFDTADSDKVAMTNPQGFIQAHEEYRSYCTLTMETIFNVTVLNSNQPFPSR